LSPFFRFEGDLNEKGLKQTIRDVMLAQDLRFEGDLNEKGLKQGYSTPSLGRCCFEGDLNEKGLKPAPARASRETPGVLKET